MRRQHRDRRTPQRVELSRSRRIAARGATRVRRMSASAKAAMVLVLESGEPALPAIEAADDGGFDDEIFPTPRRAQRAGHRGSVSPRIAAATRVVFGLACPPRGRPAAARPRANRRSGGVHASASPASLIGTWPSDTYSANRRADSSSSAHASSASNARPAGSGRRVPRWNHAGMPARSSACSSTPR